MRGAFEAATGAHACSRERSRALELHTRASSGGGRALQAGRAHARQEVVALSDGSGESERRRARDRLPGERHADRDRPISSTTAMARPGPAPGREPRCAPSLFPPRCGPGHDRRRSRPAARTAARATEGFRTLEGRQATADEDLIPARAVLIEEQDGSPAGPSRAPCSKRLLIFERGLLGTTGTTGMRPATGDALPSRRMAEAIVTLEPSHGSSKMRSDDFRAPERGWVRRESPILAPRFRTARAGIRSSSAVAWRPSSVRNPSVAAARRPYALQARRSPPVMPGPHRRRKTDWAASRLSTRRWSRSRHRRGGAESGVAVAWRSARQPVSSSPTL